MRGIEAQINVENIFGADYFPTAHNDNNIAPGAPRTIKAQLRFGLQALLNGAGSGLEWPAKSRPIGVEFMQRILLVGLASLASLAASPANSQLHADAGFGAMGLEGCRTDLRYLNQMFGWQVNWVPEWQALSQA